MAPPADASQLELEVPCIAAATPHLLPGGDDAQVADCFDVEWQKPPPEPRENRASGIYTWWRRRDVELGHPGCPKEAEAVVSLVGELDLTTAARSRWTTITSTAAMRTMIIAMIMSSSSRCLVPTSGDHQTGDTNVQQRTARNVAGGVCQIGLAVSESAVA